MHKQGLFWFKKSIAENKVKYDLHLKELYAQSERLFGIDISGIGYKEKKTANVCLLNKPKHHQTQRLTFFT